MNFEPKNKKGSLLEKAFREKKKEATKGSLLEKAFREKKKEATKGSLLEKAFREKKKEATKEIKDFMAKLKKLKLNVFLGGSFAKDTWLEDDFDVDLYVKFPHKHRGENISEMLQEKLKKFKYEKLKGSRDYFRIKEGKFVYEIVPVLEIKGKAENITDCSLEHVKFVNKNVKNKNDVRKLKLFLKANKLYGAESYLSGFSGYACELLIAYYKNFDNLLKNVAKFGENKIIDVKKYYKSDRDVLNNLNESKVSSLIIIDPIDKKRNASSAVSNENYERFKKLCKDYLRNPSEEYFKIKKFDIKEVNADVVFVKHFDNEKRDGGKIMKVYNQVKFLLEKNEFEIEKSDFEVLDKGYLWFKFKDLKLSDKVKHYGPFSDDKENLLKFKEKWGNVKTEGKRSYVVIDRKFKDVKSISKFIEKEFKLTKLN